VTLPDEPIPALPASMREVAKRERHARAAARHEQPQSSPSAVVTPSATATSAASSAPSALPADSAVTAPPVPPPETPAADASARAPSPTKKTSDDLCDRLCERTVGCAFDALSGSFSSDDVGDARELRGQRDFGVQECVKRCAKEIATSRAALEACESLKDCEPLIECFANATVPDQ